MSVEERPIYDLYSIENVNLGFAARVVLSTLVRVFAHENTD
jgi:hypothetical protein